MVQQVIAILLGLYLLLESVHAAALMPGGDRVCRVAKYLITGILGIWLMIDAAHVDALHIALAVAIALFIWPKTLERLQNLVDDLMENWHA